MDWKALITDLEDSGLTQTEIAASAKCSQPYVSQLKTGARSSPDFEVGQALVELHDKGITEDQAASNLMKAAIARKAKKRGTSGARVLPIRKR